MATKRMVIDTSIFIEHLRAKNKKESTLFKINSGTQILISAVTLYELYMGARTPEKWQDVELLTSDLAVLPLDAEVSITASKIYLELQKKNKMIEFRDIFIAATCIVNDLPLSTLNKKHFNRVKGLQLV